MTPANLKKLLTILLAILLCFGLTACAGDALICPRTTGLGNTCSCTDTWHGDNNVNAYAFFTTSTGNSCTLKAHTYQNSKYTAHTNALNNPYEFYLDADMTATIRFACTACGHDETVEAVTAPYAYFFECECVNGDTDPAMTECLAINIILGSPPAEEG